MTSTAPALFRKKLSLVFRDNIIDATRQSKVVAGEWGITFYHYLIIMQFAI
jgi:hypothetical protein